MREDRASLREWVSKHGEWASLVTIMVGGFAFLFTNAERTNYRLDAHMIAINQRADELHKRGDELHKEFCDLLKELRK